MQLRLYSFIFFLFLVSSCSPNKTEAPKENSKTINLRSICKNSILANKTNVSELHLHHCEKVLSKKSFDFENNYYVKTFKVKPVVAKYRLGIEEEIGKLNSHLNQIIDKANFAGFFIQHEPDYSVNILLKDLPDTAKIQKLYADKSWSHFTKIKQVKYSLKELKAIRKESEKVFYGLKIPFRSSMYIQKNQVGIIIEDKAKVLSLLQEKNIKLHERVKIKQGVPYVCTLIGCSNRITIDLPKKLEPDDYLFKVKFDQRTTRFYKLRIRKNLGEKCKKGDYLPIYPIKNHKPTSTLLVDSAVCKDKAVPFFKTRSVGSFSKFTINHHPNPIEKTNEAVKMEIEILNGKGKTILKQKKIISFDKKTKHQPNGKRCEPICYKTSVSF